MPDDASNTSHEPNIGGEGLPLSFAAALSDHELIESYRAIQVASVDHPEYGHQLKILIRAFSDRQFDDFELAFYELHGDRYEVIDAPQVIGGYQTPTVGVRPDRRGPAVRAQMLAVDDATYFFVEDSKLQNVEDDATSWHRIR